MSACKICDSVRSARPVLNGLFFLPSSFFAATSSSDGPPTRFLCIHIGGSVGLCRGHLGCPTRAQQANVTHEMLAELTQCQPGEQSNLTFLCTATPDEAVGGASEHVRMVINMQPASGAVTVMLWEPCRSSKRTGPRYWCPRSWRGRPPAWAGHAR